MKMAASGSGENLESRRLAKIISKRLRISEISENINEKRKGKTRIVSGNGGGENDSDIISEKYEILKWRLMAAIGVWHRRNNEIAKISKAESWRKK
jgi:hypothetical protein